MADVGFISNDVIVSSFAAAQSQMGVGFQGNGSLNVGRFHVFAVKRIILHSVLVLLVV